MSEPPAILEPVTVDKPWGREVWYSGVEERGESRVRTDSGIEPLSRYLGARGRTDPVVLLKALEPTRGDLYLEVHERKSEVYIVDRVEAAPGRMLLGTCTDRREALGDDGFRSALLAAARQAESGAMGLERVHAFMNLVELRPGDVVSIPPHVPHSLLQGVHVIEFQTPAFERKILASSQPVVTQRGWDSADAAAIIDLSGAPGVVPRGREAEQVFAMPGFKVTRLRLDAGSSFVVPAWSVGWIVAGGLHGVGCEFAPRSAFLAPEATALRAVDGAEVLLGVDSVDDGLGQQMARDATAS